jgi:transposase InsO family protein
MGTEHKRYPNLVKGQWDAKKPMELVVSDMTMIRHRGIRYEWTYMLDTFNNEIISSHISNIPGDSQTYFSCLKDLIEKAKGKTDPVVLHTDQGSVYSSQAFYNAHKDYTIIRSMSRAGVPTDNPIIEAINGWIKAEIYSEGWHRRYETAEEMINAYVDYYNNERPAYALKYKSPVQFKAEMGFA